MGSDTKSGYAAGLECGFVFTDQIEILKSSSYLLYDAFFQSRRWREAACRSWFVAWLLDALQSARKMFHYWVNIIYSNTSVTSAQIKIVSFKSLKWYYYFKLFFFTHCMSYWWQKTTLTDLRCLWCLCFCLFTINIAGGTVHRQLIGHLDKYFSQILTPTQTKVRCRSNHHWSINGYFHSSIILGLSFTCSFKHWRVCKMTSFCLVSPRRW